MSDRSVRPMMVEKPLRVNGYDIDVMGIVSNIVYVRWFEDLRYKFLDTYFPFEEMLAIQISPILAKTEIEYKYPLTIYDKPLGRVWVADFGRAKWHVSFEIETEQRMHCVGMQTGYFFDLEKKRPVPIPDRLLEHYAAEQGA